MLKQSSNRMKKGIAVLLAVLFVVSLTAVAASAKGGSYWRDGGHGHYDSHGRYGDYGSWGYDGWSYGAGCYIINGALVCPTYGYPYI
jgi:hypothetical protein